MTERLMTSKFAGRCKACKGALAVGEAIRWSREAGARCAADDVCEGKRAAAATVPPAPALEVGGIVAFITAARERGLKMPKLRALDADGTELRLGLTRSGHCPGSVSVIRGGEYIGTVTPTGEACGRLASDLYAATRAHLVTIAAEPAAEAKRFAMVTGLCTFCSLPLTDAGSIEVGYGPVCAKKWGLPHTPKGTAALVAVA